MPQSLIMARYSGAEDVVFKGIGASGGKHSVEAALEKTRSSISPTPLSTLSRNLFLIAFLKSEIIGVSFTSTSMQSVS